MTSLWLANVNILNLVIAVAITFAVCEESNLRRRYMKKQLVQTKDVNAEWKQSVGWDKLNPDQRIALLESEGMFDVHVLDDPPAYELMPNQIDYTQKKLMTRINSKIANFASQIGINGFIKKGQFAIKEFKNIETWQNLKTGAIITCNHFSPNDTFVMQKAFKASRQKKLFRVINEANYTNPPMLKFFMKNCDVLPLSSNGQTMRKFLRAVDELLARKNHILIYPEQCLWLNYRKPRPLKDGAFSFAVKNNVPVLPIFITMSDAINKKGEPMPEYTVHVLDPIYPSAELDKRKNIEYMREANYNAWVKVYENVYGEKLKYNTKTDAEG